MRRRQKQAPAQSTPVLNKELRRQRNVLTPVILALSFTLLILMSTDSMEPENDVHLTGVHDKHKEKLINVPHEQAMLEVDRLQSTLKSAARDFPRDQTMQLETPFTLLDHNSSTLMHHIWYRGEHFDGKTPLTPINTTMSLVMDAISVATDTSFVSLEAQIKSWGSHHSIRYFFGATEQDDPDSECSQKITMEDMKSISRYCSGKAWKRANPSIKYLRNRFARSDFMVRFRKTPGWMCAQKRFAHAMGKIGRFYRTEIKKDPHFQLPDYLMLQDDDTYYNMVKVHPYLEGKKDATVATADAGCLVRLPKGEITFDYPYGGFGFMVSKAAIERYIRPIDCEETSGDAWEDGVCAQIKENLIGESFAWSNKMSITDLMAAHALYYPYANHEHWRQPGYCIHGDWALGYYTNYYNVTAQSTSYDTPNAHTRIEQTLGYSYGKPEGNCLNEGQPQCTQSGHVCHRLHGISMSFVARLGKASAPEQFRPVYPKKP